MNGLHDARSIADLPDDPGCTLPVTCLVPGVGFYIMKVPGEWEQVFPISPPTDPEPEFTMVDNDRRLPVVFLPTDLPATTNVPLPVTCWVRNSGLYEMVEMGEWQLLRALDPAGPVPPSRVRP